MPAPTLASPAIATPAGLSAPGPVTLSGTAGPGAQVAVSANGQPVGVASAGVDGTWSLSVELPAGEYVIVAQTIDNVGVVVAESAPVTLTVGETAVATEPPISSEPLGPLTYDPVQRTWQMDGTTAPGQTVTVLSNGAVVGTTTTDEAGQWQLDVPADAVSGDVVVQFTDANGVTTTTGPVNPGSRPPSIDLSGGGAVVSPDGAADVSVPAGHYEWTGDAPPGTQVEVLVNGQSAGVATVDADGNWTVTAAVPPGQSTVQFRSLDAAGSVLAETQPVTVTGQTGATQATAEAPAAAPADSIADLLANRPDLSTLWAAIQAAGLSGPLQGPAAFTLFAPNNDAFAALPQSIVDGLLANPQALSAVLQYHATPGRYTAADLIVVQPSTVNGGLLAIAPQGEGITVNGAPVIEADVAAGASIAHVIDRVLLPPLAPGVRPPVIDEGGVTTFTGPALTVVGSGEPGRTILVELNGEPFGAPAVVDPATRWSVSGEVSPGEYRVIAYMLNGATLEAVSRPVDLTAR
jgi:uncharacterized surface protein with fasciclin (FAS1) repeats